MICLLFIVYCLLFIVVTCYDLFIVMIYCYDLWGYPPFFLCIF